MKKYLIAILVLSLFIVSGIAGCPSQQQKAAESAGLEVSFVNDAPPVSVSVNQEFPIYADILNKGGDFINAGDAKFYLSGVGSNLEGVKSSQTNERSLSKQSPSPDRIVLADRAKFTFPIETVYTLPLLLTSCYSYGTTAQVTLCMSAKNDSTVCSVSGEKITPPSNLVAPVQVTSLKEELTGNKLNVLFTIANKLSGQVYLKDSDCDKIQARTDIAESFKQNKVNIEIRMPDKEKSGFACHLMSASSPYVPQDSLSGTASLGTVQCEKTLAGNENYVMPFTIVMRYRYIDSVSKSINIVP